MKTSRKSAFTLVELAIVLVIIGLVSGGILVGKDLIQSAANRAYVSQLETYNSAVNSFKLKYNCLPVDCPNATDYGFICNNTDCPPSGFTGNGDGNGMVSGLVSGTTPVDYNTLPIVTSYIGWLNPEANYFWWHLRSALMILEYTKTIGVADGVGDNSQSLKKIKTIPKKVVDSKAL